MKPLSEEETEALNRHGVFLKKRVVHLLRQTQGIAIVGEEIGFSFGGTRVLDILAFDNRSKPHVLFAFECKRVRQEEKHWIFFRDIDPRYRVARCQSRLVGHSSVYDTYEFPHPPVCSEGYEFSNKKSVPEGTPPKSGESGRRKVNADQDPLFQTGAQLSAAFLGLIARRHAEFSRSRGSEDYERYVPVLVTNAKLFVVSSDFSSVALRTGNLPAPPAAKETPYLILKHPFPTPESLEADFRDRLATEMKPEHWPQVHKESIYVVNSESLGEFLSPEHRDFLRTTKDSESEERVVQVNL